MKNTAIMKQITVDLIRKRAEHNDRELSTLEELSLHQEDITRIEVIDNVCRKLKILYLQNNLIPKIENLHRLKELEYLNLALNNILRVEGLTGCEMLNKLDLTVNFIADVTSIESLKENRHLTQLYLTGNPCTNFDGYREYVICVLPHLVYLDGIQISKSERILAMQEFYKIEHDIKSQVLEYERKQQEKKKRKIKQKDFKDEPKIMEIHTDDESDKDSLADYDEEAEQQYWQEESEFSPESRVDAAKHAARQQEWAARQKGEDTKKKKKKKRKESEFFRSDGRPRNMNEGGIDFHLAGQLESSKPYVLDVSVYKHLDTSAIDLDVQPTYVRVTIKDRVFQLALMEEVNPDRSKAERSKITGHLQVTMPKVDQVVAPQVTSDTQRKKKSATTTQEEEEEDASDKGPKRELLEVGDNQNNGTPNIATIVSDAEAASKLKAKVGLLTLQKRGTATPRANDDDFVDDDDVPPLM